MPGACRMAESQQRRPSRSHCQQMRGFRCPALPPVLEHYEAPEGEEEELRTATAARALAQPTAGGHGNAGKKCSTKLRILSKLRDGYVKLLSDVAWGADYSGASSFYGCPAGGEDYSAAFYARLRREEREKQLLAGLQAMGQLQLQGQGQPRTTQQQSRMIITGASA